MAGREEHREVTLRDFQQEVEHIRNQGMKQADLHAIIVQVYDGEPFSVPFADNIAPTDNNIAAGVDGQSQAPAKCDETLQNIIDCLATFPVGDHTSYNCLRDMPLPELHLSNFNGSVVTIRPPYNKSQFSTLKRLSEDLQGWTLFGGKLAGIRNTSTWSIPGSHIQIDDDRWHTYISDLAARAGEELGFRTRGVTAKPKAQLRSFDLWEPDEMGATTRDQFYRGDVRFTNSPLISGHRLCPYYDLFLEPHQNVLSLVQLTEIWNEADYELRDHIEAWGMEIDAGKRKNHPLLFVLEGDYAQDDMSFNYLSVDDRAKALALLAINEETNHDRLADYNLEAYLVTITATTRTSASGEVSSVNYRIQSMASIRGRLHDNAVRRLKVDERAVLQPDEFKRGVSRKSRTGVTTTTRTRTCLMLTLEKLEY